MGQGTCYCIMSHVWKSNQGYVYWQPACSICDDLTFCMLCFMLGTYISMVVSEWGSQIYFFVSSKGGSKGSLLGVARSKIDSNDIAIKAVSIILPFLTPACPGVRWKRMPSTFTLPLWTSPLFWKFCQ